MAASDPRDAINAFVDPHIEELAPVLQRELRRQARRFTDEDLDKFLMLGGVPDHVWHELQLEWADWLEEHVQPAMLDAWSDGIDNLFMVEETPLEKFVLLSKQDVPETPNEAALARLRSQILLIAGNLTRQQRNTLLVLLEEAINQGHMTPSQYIQRLKALMTLSARDAEFVARRYAQDLTGGMSIREAERNRKILIDRKLKERATIILDFGLSDAWNKGVLELMKVRRARGEIDQQVVKVWITTRDDRVCNICRPLERQALPLDGYYESQGFVGQAPPAHVRCRCVLAYRRRPQ